MLLKFAIKPRHQNMPGNAIASGNIDFVLNVAQMPSAIISDDTKTYPA
jgi:hypothetical protein